MRRKWIAILMSRLVVGLGLVQLCACEKSPNSDTASESAAAQATGAHNAGSQWVLRQPGPDRPNVAVVYIHGIFGDALSTWKAAGEGNRSFYELLDLDPVVHTRADHYVFGYSSKIFTPGSFTVGEAATKLHQDLQHAGVLKYPEIVIVAHSMGGLVALDALVKRRDLAERVPLVFLYATPQEGAQIAELGARFLENDALKDMFLMDGNNYLQTLDDLWKNLVNSERHPRVRCAYEKRPTWNLGVVVPRTSSTRFCEGASPAIDADHIDITKPEAPGSSALIPLINALDELVLGEDIRAQLEMPDFVTEGSISTYTMNNREAMVRLRNVGRREMKYELRSTSSYLTGAPGTAPIGANRTVDLRLYLLVGATEQEYRFTLIPSGMPAHTVIVNVPRIDALREAEDQLVLESAKAILAFAADPEMRELLSGLNVDIVEDRFVEVVQRKIADGTELPEQVSWAMTAHLMNEANWPGLAVRALRRVESVAPQSFSAASIESIASRAAAGSGITQIFRSQSVAAGSPAASFKSPFQNREARALVEFMKGIRALQPYALSLEGDLHMRAGNRQAALDSWRRAERLRSFPSTAARIGEASFLTENAGTVQSEPAERERQDPKPERLPTAMTSPPPPVLQPDARPTLETSAPRQDGLNLRYSTKRVPNVSGIKVQDTYRQVDVRNMGAALDLFAATIDPSRIQPPAGIAIVADRCGSTSLAPEKSCALVLDCLPKPESGRANVLISANGKDGALTIFSDAVCGEPVTPSAPVIFAE